MKYDLPPLLKHTKIVLIIHSAPHDFSESEIKIIHTIVLSHAKVILPLHLLSSLLPN